MVRCTQSFSLHHAVNISLQLVYFINIMFLASPKYLTVFWLFEKQFSILLARKTSERVPFRKTGNSILYMTIDYSLQSIFKNKPTCN